MLSLSSRTEPADTNAQRLKHALTATAAPMPMPIRRLTLPRRSCEVSDDRDHRVTCSVALPVASTADFATMRSTSTSSAANWFRNASISVREAIRTRTSTAELFSPLGSLLKPYTTLFGGHG